MGWVTSAGLAVLFAGQVAANPGPAADVRTWRKAHETEIVRELADLVALPNLARDAVDIRAQRRSPRGDARARAGIGDAAARGRGRAARGVRRAAGPGRAAHASSSTPTTTASPSIPRMARRALDAVLRDRAARGGWPRGRRSDARPVSVPEGRLYARSASATTRRPIVGMLAALDALRRAGAEAVRQPQALLRGRGGGGLAAPGGRSCEATATCSRPTSGSSATGPCTRAAACRSSSARAA